MALKPTTPLRMLHRSLIIAPPLRLPSRSFHLLPTHPRRIPHIALPSPWRSMATIVQRPTGETTSFDFSDFESPDEGSTTGEKEKEKAEELALSITDAAAKQIRGIQKKEGNPNVVLRLAVESGGCHGYQYKLELTDEVGEEDYTFTVPSASEAEPTSLLVVDSVSLGLVSGSTVDYATELIGSSFRIASNPNAKGGCGCGVSWELKD